MRGCQELKLTPLARQHHRLPGGVDPEAGAAERVAAEQRGQVVDVVLARALLQQPAAQALRFGHMLWPATGMQELANAHPAACSAGVASRNGPATGLQVLAHE